MDRDGESAVLDMLSSRMEPVPVRAGYAAGIVVVSLLLLALPLIYFGVTALAGYGLYWHATANARFLDADSWWRRVLFYVMPLVAGSTLVLFMLKPLAARRREPPPARVLDRREQTFLFAFVGRLCRVVGAPLPARIQVDHQVNASAGHLGFVTEEGRTLVLTIGLPLVEALSLQQFAGVLAHEFAHFRQGTGMALSRFIWRVDALFQRLVFNRDQWDASLEDASRHRWAAVQLVFLATRLLIGVSRLLMALLMVLSRGLTFFLTRQMERDADRYQVRLVGPETFRRTLIDLRKLELPLPPELVERLVLAGRTGWFHSHPCDRERIELAFAERALGTFSADGPARLLFRDYEKL